MQLRGLRGLTDLEVGNLLIRANMTIFGRYRSDTIFKGPTTRHLGCLRANGV